MSARKIVFVFIVAFLLNVVWENIHSVLYIHYRGSAISEFILLRAAIVDAIIILLGIFASKYFFGFSKIQFLLFFWLCSAIIIEWWALSTGRWEYATAMPIIPLLQTGLTPTIQLAVLGLTSYWISNTERTALQNT